MKTINKILTAVILTIGLTVLPVQDLFADELPVWVKSFNGPGNTSDYGEKVKTDPQGNVYSASNTGTFFFERIYLVKYSTLGSVLWSKTFEDPNDNVVYLTDLVVDNSGNAYICGIQGQDFLVFKYSSTGTLLWSRNYTPPGSNGKAFAMTVSSEGNIYVAGYSVSGGGICITLKYSSSGTLQWADHRSLNGDGIGLKICLDGNGNVYTGGKSKNGNGASRMHVIKYNNAGVMQGFVQIDDADLFETLNIHGMGTDNSNNVYITGTSYYTDGAAIDIFTAKLNQNLQVQWKKRYNGPANGDDVPSNFYVGSTGLVYICGTSWGGASRDDYVVIKYLSTGVQQWSARYNGTANDTDEAVSIAVDEIGYVYVTGSSKSSSSNHDITTVKYNPLGIFLWKTAFTASLRDRAKDIAIDNSGNLYVTGSAMRFLNDDYDMVLVKYASTVGIRQISGEVPSEFALSQNYPNPFNPVTNIKFSIPKSGSVKLTVFDVTGQEVAELVNENLNAGTYNYDFNAAHLSSGVYFYKLVTNDFTDVKKMMLIK